MGPALDWLAKRIDPARRHLFEGNHDYDRASIDDRGRHAAIVRAHGIGYAQEREIVRGATRILCCTLWTDFALSGDRAEAIHDAATLMNDDRRIRVARELRGHDLAAGPGLRLGPDGPDPDLPPGPVDPRAHPPVRRMDARGDRDRLRQHRLSLRPRLRASRKADPDRASCDRRIGRCAMTRGAALAVLLGPFGLPFARRATGAALDLRPIGPGVASSPGGPER